MADQLQLVSVGKLDLKLNPRAHRGLSRSVQKNAARAGIQARQARHLLPFRAFDADPPVPLKRLRIGRGHLRRNGHDLAAYSKISVSVSELATTSQPRSHCRIRSRNAPVTPSIAIVGRAVTLRNFASKAAARAEEAAAMSSSPFAS